MADNILLPVRESPSTTGSDAAAEDPQERESPSDTPEQIMDAAEFWDRLGL